LGNHINTPYWCICQATLWANFLFLETGSSPTFVLKMTAENLRGSHFKIMDLALQLLMNGLYVGGKRSGGLGRISLKPETLVVTGFSSPKDMWDRLQEGRDIHQPLDWSEEVSRAET